MPLVSGCCCCGLRTGALILGWLGLVNEIGSLFSGIALLSADPSEMMTKMEKTEALTPEQIKMVFNTIASSMLSSAVVGILLNVALIYGTYKSHRLLLLPWLITHAISAFFIALVVVIGGLICLVTAEMATVGIVILLFGIPFAGLQIYFWICVLSLYQRFNEEEELNKRNRHQEIGFLHNAPHTDQPPSYKHVV